MKNKMFCYGLDGSDRIGTLVFFHPLSSRINISSVKTQNSSDEIESDVLITVANNNSSNNIFKKSDKL